MIDIFFIVRFSLITPTAVNSWKLAKDLDFDRYISEVLNEDRLHTRLDLFTSLTVPSIANQLIPIERDVRINIVIATSEILPIPIKYSLENFAKNNIFIKIIYVPVHKPIFVKLVDEYILDSTRKGSRVVSVRIDDDDGISLSYIKNAIKYIDFCSDNFTLSFSSGFVVDYDDGRFLNARRYVFPKIALGLAYVSTVDSYKNIYSLGSHIEIDKHTTCFSLINPENFFWTRHKSTDSNGLSDLQKKNIPTIEMNEVIKALRYEGTVIEQFISKY